MSNSKSHTSRRAFLGGALATTGALLLPRTAHAEPELDEVLRRIARARASLKTLVGPFTQLRKIGLLSSAIRSTGTMMLVRPDRLRWELAAPDEITYWITPEGLAYKSKSGEGRVQGTTARIAASLDDLRIVLGGDLALLRSRYELKLIPTSDETVAFEATPKSAAVTRIKSIGFALASDLVRPIRATLIEGVRDRAEILFGDLKRDVAVDPALMRPPS